MTLVKELGHCPAGQGDSGELWAESLTGRNWAEMAQDQPCKEEATASPGIGFCIPQQSSDSYPPASHIPQGSLSRPQGVGGPNWGWACTNLRVTCDENPGLR